MLERREAGWGLLLVLAAGYAAGYFTHPLNPGAGPGAAARGWWTWNDQGRYLAEAAAIATGTLRAENFNYPIGYPALGAAFWRAWPEHPFFVPDLLLVLAAAAAMWRIARRWLSGLESVVVGCGFGALQAGWIGLTMVVPWNTIATQAALLAGVAVTLGWSGRRRVLALAGLAAATYVVKPVDAAAFGPLLIFAVLAAATWRERIAGALAGGAVLGAAVLGVGALHLAVFGQWRSPYEIASMELAGFFAYPPAVKAYWLLIDGRGFFGEAEPALLWRQAWLLLAVPGAVFCVQRERGAGAAVVAAVAVSWGLYFNYNDFLPSDIYRFTLIHYLTWSFPLLLVWAVAAWRCGWRHRAVRVGGVVAAGLLVLAGGVQLGEKPLGRVAPTDGGWAIPAERPLVVRFSGVAPEAAAGLRLDGRPIYESVDWVRPYVPVEHLRVVLSGHATGTRLSLAGGAAAEVEVSELSWGWNFSPARWRRIFR